MTVKIIEGDCLEQTKQYENFFDSIVTDPPYGLKFMGKEWDHGVPGKHYWEQFLLSAKPGAHLLAFGGTRTHHRLMVAIEDAGWEIRDTLMWVYGSGFPKSLDVSKAIDKAAGVEREIVGTRISAFGDTEHSETDDGRNLWCKPATKEVPLTGGQPATDAAKQWDGWGTALKPAWEPVILARKPLDGTVAGNVLKWGCGGINVDGCRVEYLSESDKASATPQGSCTAKVGALAGGVQCNTERTEFTRPEQKGRFPANLIHDGSDDVCSCFPQAPGQQAALTGNEPTVNGFSGDVKFGGMKKRVAFMEPRKDSGSASRFFYCAKASKLERNIGCENLPLKSAGECTDRQDGAAGLNCPRAGAGRTNGSRNTHPTVKPIALMRYLCRLVTPQNGIILDPFAGSGSTGVAATLERFNSVLIEIEADSANVARARNGLEKVNNHKITDFFGVAP